MNQTEREYSERYTRLIAARGDKCCSCGKPSCGWRYIMPPEHRFNTDDDATVLVCEECLNKCLEIYPWWGGAYGY